MSFLPGKLDNEEILEKLTSFKCSDGFKLKKSQAQFLIEMFWRMDAYDSLISREPYLNYLLDFIGDKKKIPKSRFEFLDFVFNKLFENTEILEKLDHVGIDMESWQVNEVKNKRFLELLEEDEFPKNKNEFLYQNNIIEDRKDSKEKDVIKTGFYHHIIQEFLAAKCFLRNGAVDYLDAFAVIKEKGILAINPSWYGVIRFLLESEKINEVLTWLLKFANDNEDVVNEFFSNTLTSVEPSLLSPETKKNIFELIYNSYQKKVIWIPIWSRKALANYCQPEHLELFKDQIYKGNSNVELIVRSGNIINLISGLLKTKSKLIEKDKNFWRAKLIELANIDDENGVLKRNSLDALEAYKDKTIIPLVESCNRHKDTLVREAFVKFCCQTNANDPLAIKYFINGVKDEVNYYPRRGIYRVKSESGIKLILDALAKDTIFLERFLDKENIYNSNGKEQDKVFIKHIKDNLDTETVNILKSVVKSAFNEWRFYKLEKSYLLNEFVKLIKSKDQDYLFESLNIIAKGEEKDKWLKFYDYKFLFAWIIELDDLDKFYEQLKLIVPEHSEVALESVINCVKFSREEAGKELQRVALEKKYIKDHSNDPIPEWEKNRKTVYQEFLDLLEPVPGKYSPLVFEFYNRHLKELAPDIKPFDLERLKKVMKFVLNGVDPTKIKVKMEDRASESRSYTITEWTRYYGDSIRTAQEIDANILKKYRKNIINFIPFAYSDDRSTIEDVVGRISDKDLKFVNNLYQNTKDDARYHLPDSYIEIIEHYTDEGCRLESAKKILKSFIEDNEIKYYSRESALKLIEKFLSEDSVADREYIQNIFDLKIKQRSTEGNNLAEVANRILISKFQSEKAVDWRFGKIKRKKREMEGFKEEMNVHTVGNVESEIHDKYFAGPLVNLKNFGYIHKYFKLLDYSVKVSKNKKQNNRAFVDYLWGIFYGYLENLDPKDEIKAIELAKQWAEKNKKANNINWFQLKIGEIRVNCLLKIGAKKIRRLRLEVHK